MIQFKKFFFTVSIFSIFFIFIQTCQANQTEQDNPTVSARRSHAQDGSDSITLTDQNKHTFKFTYNEDLLIRKDIGKRGVTYHYSSNKLLTYAATDDGFIYNVVRDRGGRIVSIYGLNKIGFEVGYDGDSIIPKIITATLTDGVQIQPDFLTSQEKIDRSIQSNIRKVDQRLSLIYENIALPEVEWINLSETNVSSNTTAHPNVTNSANTSCNGCYTIHLMDIDCCNRTYPGSTTAQRRYRQMCYEGANQYYAECLRNCT